MKSLLLSGYKLSINVDGGKLVINNGRDKDREPEEHIYNPKTLDMDNIIVYGHTGNISLSGIKWCMKMRVPIMILDWNGRLLTSMTPPQPLSGLPRMAQYGAFRERRVEVARKFIEAKLMRSQAVLEGLVDKYPEIQPHLDRCNFDWTIDKVHNADRVKMIQSYEGGVATHYWNALTEIVPDRFGFDCRSYTNSQTAKNAVDPVNALFNYGYAYLESYCYKWINACNLDPGIGFLHRTRNGKSPLVYDLQEPYRWLVDLTIVQALEDGMFSKSDFITTENYHIRIRPKGVQKLVHRLDESFSQTVKYQGKNYQWNTIMQAKTLELSQYLQGKRKCLDFGKPIVGM